MDNVFALHGQYRGAARAMPLIERIQTHIAAAPVVLFMKGTPDFPQCGFSAQVVGALRACAAKFEAVDVLKSPELRQALKGYSNWPTFPQLYVDREFIGGCDIVVDMHRCGELAQMLRDSEMRFAPAL